MGLHFPTVSLFHHLSERDLLLHIAENQHHIMADLTRLQSAVQANTTATKQSVAAIQDSPADQSAIDAAAAQLEVNTASLNAAVNPLKPPAQHAT